MKAIKIFTIRVLASYQLSMLNAVHAKLLKPHTKQEGIHYCLEALQRAAKFIKHSDWLYANDPKFPQNDYLQIRADVSDEIQNLQQVLERIKK